MFVALKTTENGAPAVHVLVMNIRKYTSLLAERRWFSGRTYKHFAPPEQRQVSQVCQLAFPRFILTHKSEG